MGLKQYYYYSIYCQRTLKFLDICVRTITRLMVEWFWSGCCSYDWMFFLILVFMMHYQKMLYFLVWLNLILWLRVLREICNSFREIFQNCNNGCNINKGAERAEDVADCPGPRGSNQSQTRNCHYKDHEARNTRDYKKNLIICCYISAFYYTSLPEYYMRGAKQRGANCRNLWFEWGLLERLDQRRGS